MTTPEPGLLGPAKWWWRGGEQREIFDREFARAQRQFDDIQRILTSLGGRLDAAKPQDEVDVDADVEAIEDRVWNFNDAFYRAREAWLAGDLSGDLLSRLYEMKTPGHFGLPWASNPGGACPVGIAQNLANKLGTKVVAPDDTLWIHSNGTLTIGRGPTNNSGTWITFLPGDNAQ